MIRATLGYHTHYIVDGGKARIILAALVTPASIMDHTPMLDLACWVRLRWQLQPKIAAGDTRYGTVENIVGLAQQGIQAYLPTPDLSQRNEFYPARDFHYNQRHDLYLCPQGQELPLHARRQSEAVFVYRADGATCNRCPVKVHCTNSQSGRHIFRSFYQDYLDQASAYRTTEAYQRALRKRLVWMEALFGEAKQWHNVVRFRLRGLKKVNIEGVLKAAGQNIKRFLNYNNWWNPKHPAGGALVSPCIFLFGELAWTCYGYTEALLQRGHPGDPARAISLLEESLAISQELGMRPLAERATTLQQQSQSQGLTVAYPDGLSQREVEVLRLVAQGKSNPEIAAELSISLNTVTRHLNHIFAKIGTNNRTEAAVYAIQHGLL